MLYIVFVLVDAQQNDAWFDWMRDAHIPDVMKTGCFSDATFVRDPTADDGSGLGYRILYRAPSAGAFERYQAEFGDSLRSEHTELFGAHARAHRELLPILARFD